MEVVGRLYRAEGAEAEVYATKAVGCSLLWKEAVLSPWPHEPRGPREPVAAEEPAVEPEAWTHPWPFFALARSLARECHAHAACPQLASRHAAWPAQYRWYTREHS